MPHHRGHHGHDARELNAWLASLRFSPKDAREYTDALVSLGFDDLQSLREDATAEDLHRAGMKVAHVRRASRALSMLPNASHDHQLELHQHQHPAQLPTVASDVEREAAKSKYNGSSSGTNCNNHTSRLNPSTSSKNAGAAASAAAAASGGRVVRNIDGSIILPPGMSYMLCVDKQGLRYVVPHSTPAHEQDRPGREARSPIADAMNAGPSELRRSISSGATPWRRRAAGGGMIRTPALRNAAWNLADPDPDQMKMLKKTEEQEMHPWPMLTPSHQNGGVARNATPTPPSICWWAPTPCSIRMARSDGDNSRSPPLTGRSNGCASSGGGNEKEGNGSCGRCGGGVGDEGRAAADLSSSQREFKSMPIIGKSQRTPSTRIRLPCRGRANSGGSSSSGGGGGDGGDGGCGDLEVDSPRDSPRTESDLIHEDFTLVGSSTESSGEIAVQRVWGIPACANAAATVGIPPGYTGRGCIFDQHPQSGPRIMSRRRVRVRGAGGGRVPGPKHHRTQQQSLQQEQRLHMPLLTSQQPLENGCAASSKGMFMRRTFCGEIDPAAEKPFRYTSGRDARSASQNPHRQRFYATGAGARSMPSVNAAAMEPLGKMEMAPVMEGAEAGMGHAPTMFERGPHVKNIRRIRSTGAMSNAGGGEGVSIFIGRSNTSFCPPHAQSHGDGGGYAQPSPSPSPSISPRSLARTLLADVGAGVSDEGTAAAEEALEIVDVPEEIIDGAWKPCGGGGGGGRSLVTLDEDSVTIPSVDHHLDSAPGGGQGDLAESHTVAEEDSKSIRSGGSDGSGGGGEDDGSCGALSGLSLDLGNLQEQGFGVAPSYDLSESGTLTMHGFVLRADGIKLTPTPKNIGLEDSSRNSNSAGGCYEDHMSLFRPASLQITSGSLGRTPCSRDSSFARAGGGSAGGGGSGSGGSGGGRATTGEGSAGGGGGGSLVPLPPPPPPPLTGTPRRTREKYILLDEIGRGGGGTVHKAIHVPSMQLVAVKTVEVHDSEKRHQIFRELKTLLSMKPVPLPSPSAANGSSISTGISGLLTAGWGESPGGGDSDSNSGTGSSCGSWQDESSPKRALSPTADGGLGAKAECPGEGYHSSNSDGAPPTRTTATLSSREGTLSSRDGTGAFPLQQPQPHTPRALSSRLAVTEEPQERRQRRHRSGTSGSGGGGGGGDLYLPVVTLHDAYMDSQRGRVCMVMEYMDGGTLQTFVTKGQALPEPALAGVARSVLRGLAEMHAQRKIHRDIKPSNILLDRHGRVKISDFGVVRELNLTGSAAQTFTGTVTYMSPERITDSGHGCPSDIWSLGLVIAALALGHFPLPAASMSADNMFAMMQMIADDPIPALSPQIFSPELCGFVELMLRRDPAERPTADELLRHPFLQLAHHQGTGDLVDMVQVAPATPSEVQSIVQKVVDYHLKAAIEEKNNIERDASASFFGKDSISWGGGSPKQQLLPPALCKKDVRVLARQLQVTRTEIVREYEKIRKKAESEFWGDNPPQSSRSAWRREGSSCGGDGSGVAPTTPGFYPHSAAALGGSSGSGRRLFGFLTAPSPKGQAGPGPGTGLETPRAAGSAFAAAAAAAVASAVAVAPRRKRREGGTPAGRSTAQRRQSPAYKQSGGGCDTTAREPATTRLPS